MKGFIHFIRTQGVVGLAVGLILGAAVSDLVKSLISSFVNPIIGLILGSADGLSTAHFQIGEATIAYGAFLNTLINFIVIALVVYFGVKKFGFDKLDQPKE